MDKVSYSLGLSLGQNLKSTGVHDINYQDLLSGIQDIIENNEPKLKLDIANSTLKKYFQLLQQENKREGEEFLRNNKKQPDIISTASGLQYKILKLTDAKKPKATDTVKVNYRGTLIDGTEFDSTKKNGKPISFNLQTVIKGWTEGLQLMPIGSKFQFFIPQELAYGQQQMGIIKPYSALIFEVELIDVI